MGVGDDAIVPGDRLLAQGNQQGLGPVPVSQTIGKASAFAFPLFLAVSEYEENSYRHLGDGPAYQLSWQADHQWHSAVCCRLGGTSFGQFTICECLSPSLAQRILSRFQ